MIPSHVNRRNGPCVSAPSPYTSLFAPWTCCDCILLLFFQLPFSNGNSFSPSYSVVHPFPPSFVSFLPSMPAHRHARRGTVPNTSWQAFILPPRRSQVTDSDYAQCCGLFRYANRGNYFVSSLSHSFIARFRLIIVIKKISWGNKIFEIQIAHASTQRQHQHQHQPPLPHSASLKRGIHTCPRPISDK